MEVYVESQGQFHPRPVRPLPRRGRQDGDPPPKVVMRRPRLRLRLPGWAVIGHPELTVEATQDVDGNLVIRVM